MTRSEHTTIFSSVEDEKAFFGNAELMLDELNNLHDKSIEIINSSEVIE
jgi:hypothetical protein